MLNKQSFVVSLALSSIFLSNLVCAEIKLSGEIKQGALVIGKTAAKNYSSALPRGGNNNTIIPWELERLSSSKARNGGHACVKIEKI